MNLQNQLDEKRRRREDAKNKKVELENRVAQLQQHIQKLRDASKQQSQQMSDEDEVTAGKRQLPDVDEVSSSASKRLRIAPTENLPTVVNGVHQKSQQIAEQREKERELELVQEANEDKVEMFCFKDGKKSFDDKFINLIKEGNYEKIVSMIVDHPKEDLIDSDGTHLLHVLAKYNNIDVINFFIEFEYELDVVDSSGTTPMMIAALYKRFSAAYALHKAHVESLLREELEDSSDLSDDSYYEAEQLLSKTRKAEAIARKLLDDIVSKLVEKGMSSEQLGLLLAKLHYNLSDVVKFCDAGTTKAFLQNRNVSNFSRSGLESVVETFDWKHIEVLISHQPTTEHSLMYYFINHLINNISKFHKSKKGRKFLKRAFTWEILNRDSLKHFEEVLSNASDHDVAVFLKYGFHLIVKAESSQNILCGLFGNSNMNLSSLSKYGKIDVDERYYENNTALHIATRWGSLRNIQWLLEKGADPNAINNEQHTPLSLAFQFDGEREKCVELLLIAGADLEIISDHFKDTSKLFPDDEYFDDDITFVQHLIVENLAIKKAVGLSIPIPLKEFIIREQFQKELKSCVRNLNKLKTYVIRDIGIYQPTAITVFTILTESPERIAHLLREEDLKVMDAFWNSKLLSTLYISQYYLNALKKNLKDIVKINHLRNEAAVFICQFMGIEDPQHLVVQKVVYYLRFKDLLVFQ